MGAATRIPPLFNDMFLRVFGAQGSKRAALGLANAVLRAAGAAELERVDEISADRTEPGGAVLKSPRLDVVLRCENRLVDIEAERRPVDVYNKSLYYSSKLIVEHMPKGGDARYGRIPEVAVITLLDGPVMFEGPGFLSVGRVSWERDGGSVPGRGNPLFVVVEVAKFRRMYNELTEEVMSDELLSWLYLLSKGYESAEEVSGMSERFEAMVDFAREYGYALDDPALERDFDRWFASELEWNSSMHHAREEGRAEGVAAGRAEGRAEGIAAGRAEGRAEVVARLRELGVGEDVIARV